MTEAVEFVTMPVMRGIPAIVQEPFDFLVPPSTNATFVAIGAGPDPENAKAGLLYLGLQSASGKMLTAIVPECHLPALGDLLSAAADRIRRLDFEKPEVGHG